MNFWFKLFKNGHSVIDVFWEGTQFDLDRVKAYMVFGYVIKSIEAAE